MAVLTPQQITPAGLNVAFVAAAAGGDVAPTGPTNVLRVKNGGGASITVTVAAQAPCNQGVTHNSVVTVAAGGEQSIDLPDYPYNNSAAGGAQITYSAVTSVTVAVVKN